MNKVLFYYSLTGNCKLIVDTIKEEDNNLIVRELKIKRKMPKIFFFRVLSGGFLAFINKKDKLVDTNLSVNEDDYIIVVSPVWNDRFPPAINSLLKSVKKVDKFIFTSGSGEIKHLKKILDKKYSNSKVLVLKEPIKNKGELEKLKD